MKSWKKIGLGTALMVLPAIALAQTTVPEAGIINWFRNIEGLALYVVQFLMVVAFMVGVFYFYTGIMAFKANLDGDKQNNTPGKILGNAIAGVIFMGGVGALEEATGTLFGANVQTGAQEQSRDASRNGGL